jgi:methylenetetrahydrofolate reductase (NADPH)
LHIFVDFNSITVLKEKQVGIEWAIQQSLELKAAGVPVLHYYSMGKSENIKQIAAKVF